LEVADYGFWVVCFDSIGGGGGEYLEGAGRRRSSGT